MLGEGQRCAARISVKGRTRMALKPGDLVLRAAQQIRPYQGPQWLVEPIGDPITDQDELDQFEDWDIRYERIIGWGDYDAIIWCGGSNYLVTRSPATDDEIAFSTINSGGNADGTV